MPVALLSSRGALVVGRWSLDQTIPGAVTSPILDDEEIAIEFMRLVAAIGDGHSSIEPTGSPDFGRFYPFRLYRFTDGIFITAIGNTAQIGSTPNRSL